MTTIFRTKMFTKICLLVFM